MASCGDCGACMPKLIFSCALFTLLTLTLVSADAKSIEKLEIKYDRDTAYLPYTITEVTSSYHGVNERSLFSPIRVLTPSTPQTPDGYYVRAYNAALNVDNPAIFGLCRYPSLHLDDDNPVYLTVNDYRIYFDRLEGRKAVAGAGYKNDSAWAFRLTPETEEFDRVFLTTGRDSTGDGRWDPTINVLTVEDYDYDGEDEAFIYINSGREYIPRILFCVGMESLHVEWSLAVAASLTRRSFFSCRDSLNPSVIFTAYNPKQGVSDANFQDLYGYLTVVDSGGRILSNKIIASQHGGMALCRAEEVGRYYLTHEIEFADPGEFDGSTSATYHTSMIDGRGRVLRTVDISERTMGLFMGPRQGYDHEVLYVRSGNLGEHVHALDTNLTLLAESEPVHIGAYLGRIRISGFEPDAIVFQDAIYSPSFEKLAVFPFPASSFEIMARDSSGGVSAIALNTTNRYLIGTIDRKSQMELLSIFYVRNKSYVLTALAGLLVLLLVVNYYRRRTKHNLIVIASQKDELEQTHRALREAHEKLIEQEKYRQVKEIAGGFAHEIRNALFPAEGALRKMMIGAPGESEKDGQTRKYASLIRAAVTRAIDLTELISEYVRLDRDYLAETVDLRSVIDEVIAGNRLRIQETGTQVDVGGPVDKAVLANHHQLVIAVNNLVVNSFDSLTNIADPRIFIQVETGARFVVVSVEDNGCGIPDGIAPRIFDAFFSTNPHRGKGLGLSTTKRILEMYGGSVHVSSEKGQGSRFELRLRPAAEGSVPRKD